MSKKIYRIISFPSFVNLITMRKERYVHPLQWEDTHEGLFYTVLNRRSKSACLLNNLHNSFSDLNAVVSNFLKICLFPALTYAQCWSKESESDALWRIYSYDKMSVQIHTTENDLRTLLESYCSTTQGTVIIKDVKYDLKGTTDEMFASMNDILLNKKDISDPFFHKRPAFKHEKEKRALIYEDRSAELLKYFENYNFEKYIKEVCPVFSNVTLKHLLSAFHSFLEDENIEYDVNFSKNIPIIDLSKYIKSVKLNPFAPDWIHELMTRLCTQNGLTYEGRSKLYEKV